jgi:hypothetical protein
MYGRTAAIATTQVTIAAARNNVPANRKSVDGVTSRRSDNSVEHASQGKGQRRIQLCERMKVLVNQGM